VPLFQCEAQIFDRLSGHLSGTTPQNRRKPGRKLASNSAQSFLSFSLTPGRQQRRAVQVSRRQRRNHQVRWSGRFPGFGIVQLALKFT
jgi:hypothetical protein